MEYIHYDQLQTLLILSFYNFTKLVLVIMKEN